MAREACVERGEACVAEEMATAAGPLIPLLWTSGDVSCGFQRHSGQPYSRTC